MAFWNLGTLKLEQFRPQHRLPLAKADLPSASLRCERCLA